MKKMVKGEITVFLSLVFLLLLTLVGALLESASIQLAKNERRADAGRAVESAFAEYQKDLLERYRNRDCGNPLSDRPEWERISAAGG